MQDREEFEDRLREAIAQERAKLKEERAIAEAAQLAKTRAENLIKRAVALLGEWTFARLEIAAGTISPGARLSKSDDESLKWSSRCDFPSQKAVIEFSITGDESRQSLSVVASAVGTEPSGKKLFNDTFAVSVLESRQGNNSLYDSHKVHAQIDHAVRECMLGVVRLA